MVKKGARRSAEERHYISGRAEVDAALMQLTEVLAEIAANPQEPESASSADRASTAKSAGKQKRGAAD